ncbi:hypothetical protein CONCODRAFT_111800 [Conidiobolus coronatus NRRL 28638]|uniref:Uncharacterized protein n=1 Tax=Conidiobolus coronatus (strain ATCC 28846 / CBS 209.66 / NRRL 28638) TaxID=796925 RepID=A0A137NYI2_CONC2|nr:hypothetical protein CONCODRAFT_111800 [Conidiobolus coronatus NRRL 28638]|eukprot:KXN67728.1 hypothetical protein CONCODRAFT_111800 [Conidiobolus coronatus NRRL 28638]
MRLNAYRLYVTRLERLPNSTRNKKRLHTLDLGNPLYKINFPTFKMQMMKFDWLNSANYMSRTEERN